MADTDDDVKKKDPPPEADAAPETPTPAESAKGSLNEAAHTDDRNNLIKETEKKATEKAVGLLPNTVIEGELSELQPGKKKAAEGKTEGNGKGKNGDGKPEGKAGEAKPEGKGGEAKPEGKSEEKVTRNPDGSFTGTSEFPPGSETLKQVRRLDANQKPIDETSFKADGSSITTSADGRSLKTSSVTGEEASYKLDENKKLNSYSDASGDWSKQADGSWKNANTGEVSKSERWVDDKGALHIKQENGEHESRKLDGSKTKFDSQDRVTEITDRYGDKVKLGYKGDEKQPSSVDYGQGKWEAKNNEKTAWEKAPPPNAPAGSRPSQWEGSVKVEDGKLKDTYKNGTTVEHGDGANVAKTKGGDIREIAAGDKKYSVDYSKPGEPNKVTMPDKTVLEKKPDGWYSGGQKQFENDGIKVDKDNNSITFKNADGSRQVVDAGGNKHQYDAKGVLTQTEGADGSKTTYKNGPEGQYQGKEVVSPDGKIKTSFDSKNQVSQVEKDGQKITVERNENGAVSKLHDSKGPVTFESKDGGKTFTQSGNGMKVEGAATLKANGDYEFKSDKKTLSRTADAMTVSTADGSTVLKDDGSSLKLNNKGEVEQAQSKDGTNLSVKREEGKVTEAKIGDQTWTRSKEAGKENEWRSNDGQLRKGEFKLDRNGMTFTDAATKSDTVRGLDGGNKEGSVTRADGTVESKLDNGTKVVREGENGNITSMTSPDGRQRSMQYKDGLLVGVKDSNGTEYKRDGDKWIQTDAKGKRTELKEFSVDGKTGELSARLENGNRLTISSDGSQKELNNKNQIVKTTSATGGEREFGYDDKGNLNRVKDSRGDWRSDNGKDWNKFNDKGEKSNETWKGDISVKPDGSYSEKSDRTGNEVTRRPDGSIMTVNKDGRVAALVDGMGRSREFEYDAAGRMTKVKDGASVWTSKDGENWKKEGSNEAWKGSIKVSADGKYEELGASGNKREFSRAGEMTFKNPNGDVLEQKKLDGSTVTHSYKDGQLQSSKEVSREGVTSNLDAQGRVTSIQDKSGATRSFERDEQGRVTRISESNGSQWNLSADGKNYELKGGNGEKVPAEGLQINKDGSYQFKLDDGKQVRKNMDGSVSRLDASGKEMMRANADGSQLAFDRQGRVVAAADAQGKTRQYGYAGDSTTPNMVKEPDGKVWRSNDGKNWSREGSNQSRAGEVIVGKDGSHTVRNSKGEETTFKLDGSTVARDKDGRVTSTKDAAGTERKFEYDNKGNLTTFKDGDQTWRSRDGKNWQREGGHKWEGTISVDKDGNVREKYTSGKEVTKQTDGWQKVQENGKTSLEFKEGTGSTVVKNEQGQTTEVRYPNGTSRQFGYDAQGQVNKMTDKTGTWTTSDGQNWKKEGSNESFKGKIEVGEHGISRQVAADGSQKVSKNDGSVIEANAEGKITKVTTANGQTREFEYGADGKINKMKDTAGAVWNTTDGKNWQKQGSDTSWKGSVNVRPDGTYEERSEGTGNRTVAVTDGRKAVYDSNSKMLKAESADGQTTDFKYDAAGKSTGFDVTNKDGSKVSYNEKGQVTSSKDVNGKVREFGYSEDGKLNKVKGIDGVTWTSKDGENWKGDKGQDWKGRAFVTPDGQYTEMQGNSMVTRQLDGNSLHRDASGATRLVNPANQIVETTDAKGVKRTYGYDAQGNINRQTEGDVVWQKDGNSDRWVRQDAGGKGEVWQGQVKVEADGTYYHQDSAGNRQWRKPDGSREDVNRAEMEAAAKAINVATEWGFTTGGTDEAKFQGALEGKTVRQRQMMDEIYQEKYGKSIEQEARSEMEGHDLEKTLALLKKTDGADNAGTIRVALTELGQTFAGRSSTETQRVIRDTLETMSAAEIKEADQQYRERYGVGLRDAIMNDPNVNAKTKEAVDIYLKGHDNRTHQDSTWLAQRAAQNGDPVMFQEVMRRAPKETRDYFASAEGQKLMKDNFEGHWYHALTFGATGYVYDTTLNHTKDYAEFGRLSVATQTRDNSSWLGDNEQAIEAGLRNMPESEREMYRVGKAVANGEAVAGTVTQEQKDRAKQYYDSVQQAFKAAGNDNEQQKWEDMILHKGGSLVSRLAEHRGSIYDSSMHDVISTVENMGEADWKRLKEDPQYRDKVDKILDTYLSADEKARVMDIIDKKKASSSYDESKENQRSVLAAIDDNVRWYNNSEDQIYRSVENMTKAEREMYKRGSDPNSTDAEAKKFATDLENKLRSSLDSSEQKVAFGLLDQIKADPSKKAEMSIMDKLNLQASYMDADEAQVIRDIQEAFKKDSGLQDRIQNPKTEEERQFAAQFKDAASRALGSWDYEKYGKPLIETGKLSIELQMDLNRGIFNDDEQGAYKDVNQANDAEKQRILTDKAFQDRVLGFLSDDERAITLNSMRQGEMRAEDKLRSYMVGAGTSEDEIKQVLGDIKNRENYLKAGVPEDQVDAKIKEKLDEVKREYARKYGTDLSADLIDELGGKDLREVQRDINQRDARSEYLFARDQASVTRSGFGAGFVDAAWDGTGYQLDNEINQLSKTMVEDPAKLKEQVEQVYKAIDAHADSKEALADAVVDTTIAAVGVGGAFFTGGVSLSLLAYTGAAAAVFKVGAKAAIMGGDYDTGSSQVLLDAGTGFADGFTTFLGAGAAKSAAQKTLLAGGQAMLKEGAENGLKEGTEALIKQGLKEGGKISDDAIRSMAKQLAKEGQEEALFQTMKKSMGEALVEQSRSMLKQMVMQTPENVLAGMAGGGASGTIRAGFEAKSAEDFLVRAGTSAGFGALGGGAAPFVIAPIATVGGKAWHAAGSFFKQADNAADNVAAHAVPKPHGTPDSPAPRPTVDRVAAVNEALPVQQIDNAALKPKAVAPDVPADAVKLEADGKGGWLLSQETGPHYVNTAPNNETIIARQDVTLHAQSGKDMHLFDDSRAIVSGKGTEVHAHGRSQVDAYDGNVEVHTGTSYDTPGGDPAKGIPVDQVNKPTVNASGDATVTVRKPDTPSLVMKPESPTVNLSENAKATINSNANVNANGPNTSVKVNPGATDVNVKLTDGASVRFDNAQGVVKGDGVIRVSGDNAKIVIDAGDKPVKIIVESGNPKIEIRNGKNVEIHTVDGSKPSITNQTENTFQQKAISREGQEIGRLADLPGEGKALANRDGRPLVAEDAGKTMQRLIDDIRKVDPELADELLKENMSIVKGFGNSEKGIVRIHSADGSTGIEAPSMRDVIENPGKYPPLDYANAQHELAGHRAFDTYLNKTVKDPAELTKLAEIRKALTDNNMGMRIGEATPDQNLKYLNSPPELAADYIAARRSLASLQKDADQLVKAGIDVPEKMSQTIKQMEEYQQSLEKAMFKAEKNDPGSKFYFDKAREFSAKMEQGDVPAPVTARPKAGTTDGDAGRLTPGETKAVQDGVYRPRLETPSAAEIAELNAKFPKMGKEAAEDFSQRMNKVRDSWKEDLSPHVKRAEELAPQVDKSYKAMDAELAKVKGANPADIDAAKIDPNHPLNKQANIHDSYKTWKTAVDEHAALTSRINEVTQARAQQLQKELNEFTKAHDLPPVKVELSESMHAAGGYTFGEGTIHLPKGAFTEAGGAHGLNQNAFHELSHAAAQDQLLVRDAQRLAALDGNAGDAAAIKAKYKEATGRDLSDEWLATVSKHNDAKPPMTAAEISRAADLGRSVKDSLTDVARQSEDLGNSARVISSKLQDLQSNADGKAVDRLFKSLFDDKGGDKLAERLFGQNAPTDELIKIAQDWNAARTGKLANFDAEAARQALIKHLEPELAAVNLKHKGLIDAYGSNQIEKEAYGLAHQVAEPKGKVATDAPSTRTGDQNLGRDGNPQNEALWWGKGKDTPNNPFEMKVHEGEFPAQKIVEVNGEKFNLMKMPGQVWFYGKFASGGEGAVKLHITTDSPADLGKLQAALIPELNKNPELAKVTAWKTFDPAIGAGTATPDFVPTGKGQAAKGFTVYARTPEEAVQIQKTIDKILKDKGLGLDTPIASGNIDSIRGSSNRVGIVRDTYQPAQMPKGSYEQAAKVDKVLQEHIQSSIGMKPGDSFTDAHLRQIELQSGLRPNTLALDKNGDLALLTQARGSSVINHGGEPKLYLDESRAGKEFGDLTDRQAYYGLAKKYLPDGKDPADLAAGLVPKPKEFARLDAPAPQVRPANTDAVKVAGQDLQIKPGESQPLGRLHQKDMATVDNPEYNLNVSRNHATLSRDENGRYFIQDNGSSNGTFVQRAGSNKWEPVTGKTELGAGDRVRLGGTGDRDIPGHAKDPAGRRGAEIKLSDAPKPPDVIKQANLGGERLHVEPGGPPVPLGRTHQKGALDNPASPDYNGNVSRDHARLSRDSAGNYFIKDSNSTNGTFIKRAGSDAWEQVKGPDAVPVKPGDRIMLGGTGESNGAAWSADPAMRKGTEVKLETGPQSKMNEAIGSGNKRTALKDDVGGNAAARDRFGIKGDAPAVKVDESVPVRPSFQDGDQITFKTDGTFKEPTATGDFVRYPEGDPMVMLPEGTKRIEPNPFPDDSEIKVINHQLGLGADKSGNVYKMKDGEWTFKEDVIVVPRDKIVGVKTDDNVAVRVVSPKQIEAQVRSLEAQVPASGPVKPEQVLAMMEQSPKLDFNEKVLESLNRNQIKTVFNGEGKADNCMITTAAVMRTLREGDLKSAHQIGSNKPLHNMDFDEAKALQYSNFSEAAQVKQITDGKSFTADRIATQGDIPAGKEFAVQITLKDNENTYFGHMIYGRSLGDGKFMFYDGQSGVQYTQESIMKQGSSARFYTVEPK